MSDYPRLKAGVIAEIEAWAAGNPTAAPRKRARAAFGDPGTGPYNVVSVDGQVFLAGSYWGFPLDPAHPEAGPDPDTQDRTGISFLLRGLQAYLHRLNIAAATSPAVTDDVNAGYDPGDRWIRLDTHRTWTLHSNTVGAALWVEDTGGGGGGGGTTVTVGGAGVAATVDLSSSSPAAPANALNVVWQLDGGGAAASAYVLTDGATLTISGGALQVGAIAESQVAGLTADLATLAGAIASITIGSLGGVPTSRTISTTAPLQGGGSLAANRTLTVDAATTGAPGVVQLEANSADTSSSHVVTANDSRLSDARTPSGTIGGDLTGSTWPTLTIASSVISANARTVVQQTTVALMLSTLGGVPTTRSVSTTSPLHGGGDLSADRTLTVDDASTSAKGVVQLANNLGGTATSPTVVKVHESGGTDLALGSIPDGSFLQRSGSSVVGAGTAVATNYYDQDAAPASVSYVSPTTEFRYGQTLAGWSSFNPGSVSGLAIAQTPYGARITMGPPASGNKLSGYNHGTYPASDFIMLAKMEHIGPGSGRTTAGLALMQGTGSTDDLYLGGYTQNGAAGGVIAWVNHWAAYDAFTADDFLTAGIEIPGGYVCMWVGGNKVTTWLGASPESLQVVDFNRTLTFTPTKIGILGQGEITTRTRATVVNLAFLRCKLSTYPGTTYTTPDTLSGALRSLITP